MIALQLLISALSLYILGAFARDTARLRKMPSLDRTPGAPAGQSDAPLVSLLIPARNEARNIGRCLDGALAQSYPGYEVLVVDDGSTDTTPAILATYAARHSRLRVLQGRALPPGWTGKCNACQQAAESAHGEWLLFLDADTAPGPTLVEALVGHARAHSLDVLTIFPFLELGSFWERVVLPPFLALISAIYPFERMSDPHVRPEEVLANGQCILVRRAAYERIGGHSAVRGEVLEDVRLAQALRAAGYTIGGAEGMRHLKVRMYTSGREVIDGLTKNAVAGYRSGGARSMLAMLQLLLQALIPLWLLGGGALLLAQGGTLFAWSVLLHGLVLAMVAFGFWTVLLRRLYGLPWYSGLLWPLGLMSYCAIAARSLWQVWSGRGVVWKGRTYAG